MLNAADIVMGQTIRVAETGPAVAAVHELVAEAEAELGMSAQVGDGTNAELDGPAFQHTDRIGVVEADGPAHV